MSSVQFVRGFLWLLCTVKWSCVRTVTCDGNPQLPNACGANDQSSPLVCLCYPWNCWCPGFLVQWSGSVGMLNSQVGISSLTWLFGLQTTPAAALALGSGAADPIGTGNWELPQPKLLCSAFPPWPPSLSCERIQDVCPGCGMEEEEGAPVHNCF